jgi:hypothetical protein
MPQNGYVIAAGDDFKPHRPKARADQKGRKTLDAAARRLAAG